jgi:hypothetical protein
MPSIPPDAGSADTFFDVLSELCAWTPAVTIEPRSGPPFDAVLLACDPKSLVYERWSAALGAPTGELAVIDVDDIATVCVSC